MNYDWKRDGDYWEWRQKLELREEEKRVDEERGVYKVGARYVAPKPAKSHKLTKEQKDDLSFGGIVLLSIVGMLVPVVAPFAIVAIYYHLSRK